MESMKVRCDTHNMEKSVLAKAKEFTLLLFDLMLFKKASHPCSYSTVTPAQCLCCIEGGRGKNITSFQADTNFFTPLHLPNRPSLSFFLWTPILAPASPATVEQIVSVFHASSKQKAWDHFSKAQRKNLDMWRKQAEVGVFISYSEYVHASSQMLV